MLQQALYQACKVQRGWEAPGCSRAALGRASAARWWWSWLMVIWDDNRSVGLALRHETNPLRLLVIHSRARERFWGVGSSRRSGGRRLGAAPARCARRAPLPLPRARRGAGLAVLPPLPAAGRRVMTSDDNSTLFYTVHTIQRLECRMYHKTQQGRERETRGDSPNPPPLRGAPTDSPPPHTPKTRWRRRRRPKKNARASIQTDRAPARSGSRPSARPAVCCPRRRSRRPSRRTGSKKSR